jgi:UDP-GlcNAc:undecaprenyl-phosphate/decaprenyl-phosphate GlcNAc-1-phosphate transferase
MLELNKYIYHFPVFITLISFIIGFGFMPVVLDVARKRNFVVKPNRRTSHEGVIPNIGGVNIFISFLLTMFFFYFEAFGELQFAILGVFIILIVGLVDDLISIRPTWKLFGECASAFFLIVVSDIRLSSLHGFLGINELSIGMSYLLSLFVFIVITNSLNLIDGVDGLASGLGILYCTFFGAYFSLTSNTNLAISAFAMVGSLIVFFIYNVFGQKRKIFMGDSGSLLLGYMIALYVFEFCRMNAQGSVLSPFRMSAAPAVAICVLTVPLFDTLRVMLTRRKRGVSPFRPDKNHIHHLLLKAGLNHIQVTFILLLISLGYICLGIVGRNWPIELLVLTAFLTASILTYILWRIVDRKITNQLK